MKKRLLSVFIAAVILCLTFTACKGNKATDGNTDATGNDVSVSETTEKEETEITEKEETEITDETETKHNVFGEFESVSVDGEKVDYKAFEGKKLTMVNIWATFCSPCINEMPDLEKISKEYESKGFQIVGIPCDVYVSEDGTHDSELLAEAKHIISQTGVSYLNILPSDSLNEKKLDIVYSVPETVFLDENGNQIGESYIGSRTYDQWCDVIDGILADIDK